MAKVRGFISSYTTVCRGMKDRCFQAERDSMEACVMARAQELESLTAENSRLKSDWKLREDGLSSSHEIRIQHLMKSLQEREQQNCDLHKSLHKAKVGMQSVQSEAKVHLEQSEARYRYSLLETCTSASSSWPNARVLVLCF